MSRSSRAARRILAHPGLHPILGTGLSLFFLVLALRQVTPAEIGSGLLGARPLYLVLALGSVGITVIGRTLRWAILLGPAGHSLPISTLGRVILIGQMLNTLIPARLGDLARAYTVGRAGPGGGFVLATIVVEKLLDMVVYVVYLALLLLAMPLPAAVRPSVIAFLLLTVVFVISVVFLHMGRTWFLQRLEPLLARWLPEAVAARTTHRVRSGLAGLEILAHGRSMGALLAWSLIIWGAGILTNYLVLKALDLSLPPAAPLLVWLVLQIGVTLPSAPGFVGVFEYLCMVALGVFQVAPGPALTYGVLLHIVVFAPTTLLGIAFFWRTGLSLAQLRPGTAAQ